MSQREVGSDNSGVFDFDSGNDAREGINGQRQDAMAARVCIVRDAIQADSPLRWLRQILHPCLAAC